VLLTVAAASVLIGTLYPLALELLGGERLSVGPPYFEAVFVPLMVPALFLMGVGPVARWRRAALPELALRLRWALGAGVAAALAQPLLVPASGAAWPPRASLGLLLAGWVLGSAVVHARQRLSALPGGWLERARRQPRAWYGMLAAHAGLGVFVFAVTLANGFEARRELRLAVGERVAVGGFDFAFEGLAPATGPNYDAQRATVIVTRRGEPVATLHPEKRRYRAQDAALSQAAIDVGLTRDLFVALGDPVGPTAWTLRIQVKPFMAWIWAGCALMALGGLLAATDRRYRLGRAGRAALPEDGLPTGAVAAVAAPREGA